MSIDTQLTTNADEKKELHLAHLLESLGECIKLQGRKEEADHFYEQALAIYEKIFGLKRSNSTMAKKNYTSLIRNIKRDFESTMLKAASTNSSYYTCFISYSSKDQMFAEQLYTELQSRGVRCWFAPEDMKIGDKIRHRIDESIHLYEKLLLVLSKHSITSQWIEQEVEMAFEKERKENRAVLFPIRLDETVMDIEGGWPAFIRNTRLIGDFTNWGDQSRYQNAFERLLRNLRIEPSQDEN